MADKKILIIDDNEQDRIIMRRFLKKAGYDNILEASSGEEGLEKAESENPDIIITDTMMPGIDGLQLMQEIKSRWAQIVIIVISGQATVRMAVDAMKAGAEELIMKPVTDLELLSLLISRSLHKKWLQSENQRLKQLLTEQNSISKILGSSKEIQTLLDKVKKIAPLETTILLTGETGVGKSLFARIIHDQSKRKSHKFVSVNCGALTETLLESTLFGHKRGAFTGR